MIRREVDICRIFIFNVKKQNVIFRLWYYFRNGRSTYFAFIFAAINTLTVTYYLAIEKYPTLQALFPNFGQYVFVISAVGIPILVLIGYAHFKRSQAFKSEADIALEVNPYHARIVVNTELNLKLSTFILNLLEKNQLSETFSVEEKQEIENFRKELEKLTKNRSINNKDDTSYFRKLEESKEDK